MNLVGNYFIGGYTLVSNNYPSWWDTTVTLYNKFESSTGEVTWYRTVLEGCFWKYVTDYVRTDNATEMIKVLLCRVRKNSDFLEPEEWCETDDKDSHFTFSDGDILIKGEVDDVLDEYTKGQRASDLLKKYKNRCAEIKEYSGNVGVDRVNEHYLVRGL